MANRKKKHQGGRSRYVPPKTSPNPTGWGKINRVLRWRPAMNVELLAAIVCVYFAAVSNTAFWRASAAAGAFDGPNGWAVAPSLFVAVAALHFMLLCCMLSRLTAKVTLTLLLIVTSSVSHFATEYTVYLDAEMLRAVLKTDARESSEFLTTGLLVSVLIQGILPSVLIWRVRLTRYSWPYAIAMRSMSVFVAIAVATAAIQLTYHEIASLMRNHKSLRYLIAPGNIVVAMTTMLMEDQKAAAVSSRRVVAPDAVLAEHLPSTRPHTLVIVVGETVRAQNWGLSGYTRQTTPQLARLDVVNFASVTACGSNTEVSVPCMFSSIGRRAYDRAAIQTSESLLHVLERAGIRTLWRDNQTGCKGVCDGLAFESYRAVEDDSCDGNRCSDAIMLEGLSETIAAAPGDFVAVLHQLGNHGPAYYRRFPPALTIFQPSCASSDLGTCTREEVVNAYDNAILATDDFLAKTIAMLKADTVRDSALIYVSDHGESLGENNLYLHGLPYVIAPATQIQVPMTVWVSPGLAQHQQLDLQCLRRRAELPASHDNLFHSVLGLLEVSTQIYDARLDVFGGCRG